MKATKELKDCLEQLQAAAEASDDLQITIMDSRYEIHWRDIQLDVYTPEDLIKALNAFAVIEQLGAKDYEIKGDLA